MMENSYSDHFQEFWDWAEKEGYGDLGLLPLPERERCQELLGVMTKMDPKALYVQRVFLRSLLHIPDSYIERAFYLHLSDELANRHPTLAEVVSQAASHTTGNAGRDWGDQRVLAQKFFFAPKSELLSAEFRKNPDGARMAISRSWRLFKNRLLPDLETGMLQGQEKTGLRVKSIPWWQVALCVFIWWGLPLDLSQEDREAARNEAGSMLASLLRV